LKAAVFLGPRRVKVLDVETPTITSDEVLIKTKAAGICGSDLHFYLGKSQAFQNLLERIRTMVFPLKTIIGHEFSGSIVDKGKNVNDIELNERVTAVPILPCHECKYCKMGLMYLCENIHPWPGAFSEFVKVPSENIVKVPAKLSYEEAAMLEPLACAVHAVKLAKIEEHHSVAIIGAGTIGLLILQVARAFGAKEILVTDILDFKLKIAKTLGADIVVNALEINSHDREGLIKNIDIIFECVGGSASTLNQALNLIDKRGKIIVLGVYSSSQQIDIEKFREKELTMMVSKPQEKRDFENGIDLVVNGKVKLKPLITHKFPLKNINEAFKTALQSKRTKSIKVQIIM